MKRISVIIPVYKVAEYMDNCIQSVVDQTYHNLEIILVDDGSPDSCPQKCEEWKKIDRRIKVIHKSNGGLSSARNAGLEISSGEYVSFVDSDDWIEKDMYMDMVSVLESKNVDFVAGKILCYFQNSGKKVPFMEGKDRYIIAQNKLIEKDEYRNLIIGNHIEAAAWNKLYRREYIGSCRFKEGRLFEDYLFAYYVTKKMHSMYYIAKNYYNYRIRSNSITTSKKYDSQWEDNFSEITEDIKKEKNALLLNELNSFQLRHYLDNIKKCSDKNKKRKMRRIIGNLTFSFWNLSLNMKIKFVLHKLRLL